VKKIVFYFLLLDISLFIFAGCANTMKGIGTDTKENWQKLKEWDKEFQENYW
jgi:predicted small secreted protein